MAKSNPFGSSAADDEILTQLQKALEQHGYDYMKEKYIINTNTHWDDYYRTDIIKDYYTQNPTWIDSKTTTTNGPVRAKVPSKPSPYAHPSKDLSPIQADMINGLLR